MGCMTFMPDVKEATCATRVSWDMCAGIAIIVTAPVSDQMVKIKSRKDFKHTPLIGGFVL